jgi:hypothetical protein
MPRVDLAMPRADLDARARIIAERSLRRGLRRSAWWASQRASRQRARLVADSRRRRAKPRLRLRARRRRLIRDARRIHRARTAAAKLLPVDVQAAYRQATAEIRRLILEQHRDATRDFVTRKPSLPAWAC